MDEDCLTTGACTGTGTVSFATATTSCP
jgi:hypothetical protein